MASQSKYVQNVTVAGAWNNPGNATGVPDNTCADSSNDGDISEYNFLGSLFTIPAGSAIDGITVILDMAASDSDDDAGIQLADTLGWVIEKIGNNANGPACANSVAIAALGGVADLWGGTWTVAHINSVNFHVRLIQEKSAKQDTSYVDSIYVTVYYTEPTTTTSTSTSTTSTSTSTTSTSTSTTSTSTSTTSTSTSTTSTSTSTTTSTTSTSTSTTSTSTSTTTSTTSTSTSTTSTSTSTTSTSTSTTTSTTSTSTSTTSTSTSTTSTSTSTTSTSTSTTSTSTSTTTSTTSTSTSTTSTSTSTTTSTTSTSTSTTSTSTSTTSTSTSTTSTSTSTTTSTTSTSTSTTSTSTSTTSTSTSTTTSTTSTSTSTTSTSTSTTSTSTSTTSTTSTSTSTTSTTSTSTSTTSTSSTSTSTTIAPLPPSVIIDEEDGKYPIRPVTVYIRYDIETKGQMRVTIRGKLNVFIQTIASTTQLIHEKIESHVRTWEKYLDVTTIIERVSTRILLYNREEEYLQLKKARETIQQIIEEHHILEAKINRMEKLMEYLIVTEKKNRG